MTTPKQPPKQHIVTYIPPVRGNPNNLRGRDALSDATPDKTTNNEANSHITIRHSKQLIED